MMRMSYADFSFILNQIEVDIAPKQILGGCKVISPKARLALPYPEVLSDGRNVQITMFPIQNF